MSLKKIIFFTGHDSKQVNNYYLNLTPSGKGIFKNYKFVFNKLTKDYDYIVVFEKLLKKIDISICREKVVFIAAEGSSIKKYNDNFLQQFGHVITCQKKINHKSKYIRSPGHSWFYINKTYDDLVNLSSLKKNKTLSIVISKKAITKGHRDRINFALKLKKHLGEKIDLVGHGFSDLNNKWDMVSPYKYSIAIENSIEDHWITEKLTDCFVAHTFPFYIGASNIDEYYDPKSYIKLDINDFESSLKIILKTLNDPNHYYNNLDYIKASKMKYINEHCLIPMVCNFINGNLENKKYSKKVIHSKLLPEYDMNNDIGNILYKIKEKVKITIYNLLFFFRLNKFYKK